MTGLALDRRGLTVWLRTRGAYDRVAFLLHPSRQPPVGQRVTSQSARLRTASRRTTCLLHRAPVSGQPPGGRRVYVTERPSQESLRADTYLRHRSPVSGQPPGGRRVYVTELLSVVTDRSCRLYSRLAMLGLAL